MRNAVGVSVTREGNVAGITIRRKEIGRKVNSEKEKRYASHTKTLSVSE